MIRFPRLALLAFGAAICFSTDCGAETAVPDPARAWQLRDLAPLEAWLEAVANGPGEDGGAHPDERVPVLRAKAWLARRDGSHDRALALIDRAIELAPDRADLRVDRAAFLSDRIQASGAFRSLRIARDVRRDLEHALVATPGHVDAIAALAAFHQRAPRIAGGDKQAAADLMVRLGELAPARQHFREAVAFADEERFGEAVDRIGLAISQLERPRPDWLARMGDWLLQLDRGDDALEAYRRALAQAPRYAPALFGIGRLAAESGLAADDGIAALQHFLELSRWPQDPEARLAWWHLGRIHARAGCRDLAAAAFRRALDSDPGWAPARRSLDELPGRDVSDAACGSGVDRLDPP